MPDPTTDFSIFDGQELVTFVSLAGTVVNNVPALRRPLTQSRQRNVERYVELLVTDVVFHLASGPLAAVTLAVGDMVMDANSISHELVFVERQTLNNTVTAIGRPIPP